MNLQGFLLGPFLWGFVWLANCGRWGKGQQEVANRALRDASQGVHWVTGQIHFKDLQIHLKIWQIHFAIWTSTRQWVANRALRDESQGVHWVSRQIHLKIWQIQIKFVQIRFAIWQKHFTIWTNTRRRWLTGRWGRQVRESIEYVDKYLNI